MTIQELNKLDKKVLKEEMLKCCGAEHWAAGMCDVFPVKNKAQLFEQADAIWNGLDAKDWLEAFTHHPKIGDVASLKKKFASTAHWASGEQSGVNTASDEVIAALAEGNSLYEEKFGFIFIVCATGKTAAEMLALLQQRIPNKKEEELLIAAEEQRKITRIRLEKLLNA